MRIFRRCRRVSCTFYLIFAVVVIWALFMRNDDGYEGNIELNNVQLIDKRTWFENEQQFTEQPTALKEQSLHESGHSREQLDVAHLRQEESRTEAVQNYDVLEQLLNERELIELESDTKHDTSTRVAYEAVQFISEAVQTPSKPLDQSENVEEIGQWDHEKEDLAGLEIVNERTTTEQPADNDNPLEIEKSNIETEMELFVSNLTDTSSPKPKQLVTEQQQTTIEHSISSYEEEILRNLETTTLDSVHIEQLASNNVEQSTTTEQSDIDKEQRGSDTKYFKVNNELSEIDHKQLDAEKEQPKLDTEQVDLEQYQDENDTVQPMENEQQQQEETETTLEQSINEQFHQPQENETILEQKEIEQSQQLEETGGNLEQTEKEQSQKTEQTVKSVEEVADKMAEAPQAWLDSLSQQSGSAQTNHANHFSVSNSADPLQEYANITTNKQMLREISEAQNNWTALRSLTETLIGTTLSGWNVQASAANRTSRSARLLIYNRVPKCGSTTFKNLLAKLGTRNHFVHLSSRIFGEHYLSKEKEREYVEQLMKKVKNCSKPISVDRHVYFVDFTKYGYPQPTYINVLRDPIEKFVSTFYYIRSERRWQQLLHAKHSASDLQNLLTYHKNFMPPEAFQQGKLMRPFDWWMNKTLTECVLSDDIECQFETGASKETSVSFFCGSLPICRVVNSAGAVQRAKHNLEEHFAVVGLVEQLQESMVVMEQYVPQYLANMNNTYSRMGEKSQQRNKTPHPTPEPKVREVLSRSFVGDLELYNFAKQRLYLQYRHIQNIKKTK